MPNYRELFINEFRKGSFGASDSYIALESARVTSFRTHPHRANLGYQEISDQEFDPYAYFLTSTDRRRYENALASRGLPARGRPDMGHPYESVKHIVRAPAALKLQLRSGDWTGPVVSHTSEFQPHVHSGDVLSLPNFGSDGLGTFAQQAYARVAPTSVVFDAANFLGELREGLPRLASQALRDSSRFFKGVGGDYLNVTFGWLPFLSDLQNAGKALYRATMQLSQQGQRVHRRYSVPMSSAMSTEYFPETSLGVGSGFSRPSSLVPAGFPVANKAHGIPYPFTSAGSAFIARGVDLAKTVRQERWFEGEFSSFYPLNFDPSSYIERLNQLVNLKVTPLTLWNLAPWSWLVDWNLRIGDSIEANQLRANDLLIMHYGYAMEKSVYQTQISARTYYDRYDVFSPLRAQWTGVTTRKRRIRANPYGFKVGGASALTGGQLAILGALGLTKAL